jgi:hypothetical protein
MPTVNIAVAALSMSLLVGLFAQTTPRPAARKPAAKAVESKEHAAVRIEAEAKMKDCEAGDEHQSSENPGYDIVLRRLKAEVALSQAKLEAVGKDESEKARIIVPAEMRLQSCDESKTLEIRLVHVDSCVATYHKTIDKKGSDLTVRESEQVKTCQSLDLYPPQR